MRIGSSQDRGCLLVEKFEKRTDNNDGWWEMENVDIDDDDDDDDDDDYRK